MIAAFQHEPVRPPPSTGEDMQHDSHSEDTLLCSPCVGEEQLLGDLVGVVGLDGARD